MCHKETLWSGLLYYISWLRTERNWIRKLRHCDSSVATGGGRKHRVAHAPPTSIRQGHDGNCRDPKRKFLCGGGFVGVLSDQLNQTLWWMIWAKTVCNPSIKCPPYDAGERIVWTDVLSLVNCSGPIFMYYRPRPLFWLIFPSCCFFLFATKDVWK